MRTFVLGDVHGAARALEQVFERSGIDKDNDLLVFLGDVVDGWPETPACIDLLLSVRHLVPLRGNHCEWFMDWLGGEPVNPNWYYQGGKSTLESYAYQRSAVPQEHVDYFNNTVSAYVTTRNGVNQLFVHGGCGYPFVFPTELSATDIAWDREMWTAAREGFIDESIPYDEVYVGHTSTAAYSSVPCQAGKIWNLDQGCGWHGKLSIMDVDTKEFWQSDTSKSLYPHIKRPR